MSGELAFTVFKWAVAVIFCCVAALLMIVVGAVVLHLLGRLG